MSEGGSLSPPESAMNNRASSSSSKGTSLVNEPSASHISDAPGLLASSGPNAKGENKLPVLGADPSTSQQPGHTNRTVIENHPLAAGGDGSEEPPALARLAPYTAKGVELDSSSRYPPPRCYPGTCQDLLEEVSSWLMNVERPSDLLWLYGTAGAGKTAIAQTVGEYCRDQLHQLGATFFFENENKDCRLEKVIPTIASQLASRFPPYRELLSSFLNDHPGILDQNVGALFQSLIVDLFADLNARGSISSAKPLVIVLDGLEECPNVDAQAVLINIVGNYIQNNQDRTLLWIITSRPEVNIKGAFIRLRENEDYIKKEVIVKGETAESDVRLYIEGSLEDIRQKYWDVFDQNVDTTWPSRSQLSSLNDKASGYFPVAVGFIDFVMKSPDNDPKAHLEVLLGCLESTSDSERNPFHFLDKILLNILQSIPADSLSTALRILNFCAYNPKHVLSPRRLSNFLCVDGATFLTSLRRLHSLFEISFPSPDTPNTFNFYHPSFGAFLRDSSRSGSFHLPEDQVFSDIALQSLRWLEYCIPLQCVASGISCCTPNDSSKLEWVTGNEETSKQDVRVIGRYAFKVCWKACLQAAEEDMPAIQEKLTQLKLCRSKPARYRDEKLTDIVRNILDWHSLMNDGEINDDDDAHDDEAVDGTSDSTSRYGREGAALFIGLFAFAAAQWIAY